MTGSLYRIIEAADPHEDSLPMLALISGFSDSGSTISQLSQHLFTKLNSDLIASFSNDELLDYRSRRPALFFEKDHIEDYDSPSLGLYKMCDEAGKQFLLLDGYEPDFRWEAFSRAVRELAERFGATSFSWINAIPFPIPHTRPVGVTVSGNQRALIERYSEWKPQTQVPGNILHLIEYNLSKVMPTTGFVLLVPHYLAENEVPAAALKALELISAATSLVIPADDLRERASQFESKLASQIADNQELAKLIATLEQGYASSDSGPARAPIATPRSEMPSADQIAAELEKYLATMRRQDDEGIN
jgi:predicted ATP-grasp superfamily ATP-dependent carboligase